MLTQHESQIVIDIIDEDILQRNDLDHVGGNAFHFWVKRMEELQDVLFVLKHVREHAVLHIAFDNDLIAFGNRPFLYNAYSIDN